jgi:hypothetical protein
MSSFFLDITEISPVNNTEEKATELTGIPNDSFPLLSTYFTENWTSPGMNIYLTEQTNHRTEPQSALLLDLGTGNGENRSAGELGASANLTSTKSLEILETNEKIYGEQLRNWSESGAHSHAQQLLNSHATEPSASTSTECPLAITEKVVVVNNATDGLEGMGTNYTADVGSIAPTNISWSDNNTSSPISSSLLAGDSLAAASTSGPHLSKDYNSLTLSNDADPVVEPSQQLPYVDSELESHSRSSIDLQANYSTSSLTNGYNIGHDNVSDTAHS